VRDDWRYRGAEGYRGEDYCTIMYHHKENSISSDNSKHTTVENAKPGMKMLDWKELHRSTELHD